MKKEPAKTFDKSRRTFIQGAGIAAGGLLSHSVAGADVSAANEMPSTQASSGSTSPAAKLRQLVEQPTVFGCPVIHDVLSAKLAEFHGFPSCFAGGLPISYTMYGVGDFGMITISELIEFATRIAFAVEIPVMADADDGGGNPLNVYRAIQRYERGGVAGVMIEDLTGAKHLPVREGLMSSKEAMADKIRAALDARRDQNFVILARSDALSAKEPQERMVERIVAYAEAGADMLFVPGMPLQEIPRMMELTKRPFMGIVTQVPLADQQKHQVRLGSYSVPLVSLAAGAVHKALGEMKATGVIQEYNQRALPNDIMAKLTERDVHSERAKKYNAFRL